MANEPRAFGTRPESTIAQNFAADLDSMFGLHPVVEKLTKTVEEKKQTVSSGAMELQALEARLREAEQRLARVSRHTSSPSRTANIAASRAALEQRPPAGEEAPTKASSLAQQPSYPTERPQTHRADPESLVAGMPGAMPSDTPAPYNSSSEYVMVDRHTGQSAQRGFG